MIGTTTTIRAILAADLIYSVASLALYALAFLAYRWWKRRRPAPPVPIIGADVPDVCWHCPHCHKPIDPELPRDEQRKCIQGGKLCKNCGVALHTGPQP